MTDEASTPSTAPAAPNADCAAQLAERFPALFGGAPKPIKLRIHADIHERAPGVFSKQQLSAFFRRYTMSTPYLVALSKATQRFDLDGEPAGELSEEHKQAALAELARRRALRDARRELEEAQRRHRATLLRDFERTTLTPANFCALKGVALDQLDALLEQARAEARERAAALPREAHERTPRADRDRRDARADAQRRGPRGEREARQPARRRRGG